MRIELVYDAVCPNVEAARAVLARALDSVGLSADWSERCQDGEESRYASPTILIDGEDIMGETENLAPGCRIYRDSLGRPVHGPPVEIVEERLRRVRREYGE